MNRERHHSGETRNSCQILLKNINEIDHLGYLGLFKRIILKWILKYMICEYELDSSALLVNFCKL